MENALLKGEDNKENNYCNYVALVVLGAVAGAVQG